MEAGVCGVSLASAPAPVAEEYSFAHVIVTIQGTCMKLSFPMCVQKSEFAVFNLWLIMQN